MNTPEILNFNPQALKKNCITWYDKNNNRIGCLSWDADGFKFEGKVDESAKLFFDYLADNFDFPKAATPTFIEFSKN